METKCHFKKVHNFAERYIVKLGVHHKNTDIIFLQELQQFALKILTYFRSGKNNSYCIIKKLTYYSKGKDNSYGIIKITYIL